MDSLSFNNVKEQQHMILEPLQVMINLALLNYCPVGTKISISNNNLHIQQPTIVQGVVRWWNKDTKDDLYYLFHAIRRYYLWYKSKDDKRFDYILATAIKGITKLIETYSASGQHSITHTLSLYKNILDMDNQQLFQETSSSAINMDQVFQNCTTLYSKHHIYVVYNILQLLESDANEESRFFYLEAMRNFLNPLHISIRSWINNNLSC